jgi:pimeloyl-ACP methyl ester carboxylesterase
MSHTIRRFAASAAACAVLVLTACGPEASREGAATETRPFSSDRISVTTRGTGPDIVLIPGLASPREVWGSVADSLDGRYRLHLVQVNGFAGIAAGANGDGPVSAPVAEEIGRYIRESGLERPAIIGHSMGGSIGMMLAARDSAAVGRLMVVDMTPFMGMAFGRPDITVEGARPMANQMRDTILAQTAGAPTGMLEQAFAGMVRAPVMRDSLLRNLTASDRRTVANAFHELIVTDLRPELGRIRVPVTVLYVLPAGPMTAEQYDALTRQLYANIANAHLVRIDDSNHFIQFDQPVRMVTEVDAFMKR